MAYVANSRYVRNMPRYASFTRLRYRLFATLTLGLLLGLGGCGAGASTVGSGTVFDAELDELFDNGVDLIDRPELLDGAWSENWSATLKGRSLEADFIALVRVETLRSDVNLDQRTTYRFVVVDEGALDGSVPDEPNLVTTPNDRGYGLVQSAAQSVLGARFLLFGKYEIVGSPGAGAATSTIPRLRFHLSPASVPVMDRVQWLINNMRVPPDQRRRRVERVHTATP